MQISLPLWAEEIEKVSFRELVPEIPSTNYATHGVFYYPARFIPQVVRFALRKWTKEGDWVIDPFAGAGTVAVECVLLGRNAFVADLNPILKPPLEAKIPRNVPSDWSELLSKAQRLLESRKPFIPKWSRISYWHPPEFFDALSKMWGGYYEEPDPLILPALLKTTRKFSFADDQVPKLFKSRRKTREVEAMLARDWRSEMRAFFLKELAEDFARFKEFEKLLPSDPGDYFAFSGVDSLTCDLPQGLKATLLITSPPYGIAHEYIRSVKLELAWLGYSDEEITWLTKHEIPYNSPPQVEVNSPTYEAFKSNVPPRLRKFYHAYFKSVVAILERFSALLQPGGRLCLFIGEASLGGTPIPIHRILREHFETKGFFFEKAFSDTIKARKLFKGRKNPSPDGIQREILLILRR